MPNTPFRIDAPPIDMALDRIAEPNPRLLSQSGTDQRRRKQHVRRYATVGVGHGLFRWQPTAHVAMAKRIYASDNFFMEPSRLAPQPSMVDLRLRAAPR